MQEVGWPEPAAVVAIIESTLNRFAFCWIASMVAAEGAAVEVALIIAPYFNIVRCKFTFFGRGVRGGFFFATRFILEQRGVYESSVNTQPEPHPPFSANATRCASGPAEVTIAPTTRTVAANIAIAFA